LLFFIVFSILYGAQPPRRDAADVKEKEVIKKAAVHTL
jgi:hypothetical protein